MDKFCYLLFISLLLFNTPFSAQNIVQLGAPLVNDTGNDLMFTQYGGFVTSGAAGNRAVLYKTDCAGNILAQIEKAFVPGPARFQDAVELPDGSIVAVGSAVIATPTDTLQRAIILKTTSGLVETTFADFLITGKAAAAKSVTLTADGDLLVLGEVAGFVFDFTDMFLLRLSPTILQPLDDPEIYNNGVDVAEEIIRTADNNYLLAGNSFLGNIFDPGALIINRLVAIKVDESGDPLWQYMYQDTFPAQYGLARIGSVEQNIASGNIMLSGATYGGSANLGLDPLFILLDNNGNFLDTAILHEPLRQNIFGSVANSNLPGLYTAVGESENPVFGTPNLLVAQALEFGDQIVQAALSNDAATPISLSDIIEIPQSRLSVMGNIPDNPIAFDFKDILVATPGIDDIEIEYQNCALTASFSALDPDYQWHLNGNPIAGANSGFYFPKESGVYHVELSDAIGCTGSSDTLTVTLASADFTVTSADGTYSFVNASEGATSYKWDFGDGTTSTDLNPDHTYTASASYPVTLIAFSPCGNDTLTNILVGAGEPSAFRDFRLFPNPNDGRFTLAINGAAQDRLVFSLFNPLGQTISRQTFDFQTGTLLHTFDFSDLSPAVYTLQMQAKGETKYVKIAVRK